MKIIKSTFLAFIMFTTTTFASYAPNIVVETLPEVKNASPCDESVKKCVMYYSEKYDVPMSKLAYIIENESHYNEKAIGDMNLTCKRTGKPVRARGILQITECYYPEINDKCAFSAECSLNKMILLIKNDKTCKSQWTTCRNYFNQVLQ